MNPLRQRMMQDMDVRNFARGTQATYLRQVVHFAAYFRKSRDQWGAEDVRTFLLSLMNPRLSPSHINVTRWENVFSLGNSVHWTVSKNRNGAFDTGAYVICEPLIFLKTLVPP